MGARLLEEGVRRLGKFWELVGKTAVFAACFVPLEDDGIYLVVLRYDDFGEVVADGEGVDVMLADFFNGGLLG